MDSGVLKMIQERFDNAIKRYGEKVTIDSVEYDAVIRHMPVGNTLDYDDKKITTAADITRGTIINYKGKDYVVISEVNDKRYDIYYEAIMRRVPIVLDVELWNEKANHAGYDLVGEIQVPCFVSTMSTTEEGKYAWDFQKIIVIVPDRPEFNTSRLGKVVFTLFHTEWKCKVEYMDTSKPGLNFWHCDSNALL
jgi:hypothetical protein